MTELLNKAFEAAKKLSSEDQDALGRELLERISADARWEELFADPRSRSFFAKMAAEVRADIAAGDVIDGDPGSAGDPATLSALERMWSARHAPSDQGQDGLGEAQAEPGKRPKAGS